MNNLFGGNLVVIYINSILFYSWNETLSTYGAYTGKAVGAFCISLNWRSVSPFSHLSSFSDVTSVLRGTNGPGEGPSPCIFHLICNLHQSKATPYLNKLFIKRRNLKLAVLSHFRLLSKDSWKEITYLKYCNCINWKCNVH